MLHQTWWNSTSFLIKTQVLTVTLKYWGSDCYHWSVSYLVDIHCTELGELYWVPDDLSHEVPTFLWLYQPTNVLLTGQETRGVPHSLGCRTSKEWIMAWKPECSGFKENHTKTLPLIYTKDDRCYFRELVEIHHLNKVSTSVCMAFHTFLSLVEKFMLFPCGDILSQEQRPPPRSTFYNP